LRKTWVSDAARKSERTCRGRRMPQCSKTVEAIRSAIEEVNSVIDSEMYIECG